MPSVGLRSSLLRRSQIATSPWRSCFFWRFRLWRELGICRPCQWPPTHLDFAPGIAKPFLYPRAGYVPKVPSVTPQPVVLQAFSPPPFRSLTSKSLIVCVQCEHWMHTSTELPCGEGRTNCWFALVPLKEGRPASKQTLSWWIVDAIHIAYESSGLPSPMGVKAHSTRSVAASKAFLAGVPIQDICNAAGWSTPLTFVRFYGLDMRATPGSSILSP